MILTQQEEAIAQRTAQIVMSRMSPWVKSARAREILDVKSRKTLTSRVEKNNIRTKRDSAGHRLFNTEDLLKCSR